MMKRPTPSELRRWRWYQSRVAALFSRVKSAVVEEDVHEVGLQSSERRQLDVRVTLTPQIDLGRGFVIEVPIKIVVDAKDYGRALDIPAIERLIGLKDDVAANLLIVVTPKGVSRGAMKRARAGGVYPMAVTDDLLALIAELRLPEYTSCKICEYGPEDDRSPSEILWTSDVEGHCTWCNTIHVRCPDCFEIFAVPRPNLIWEYVARWNAARSSGYRALAVKTQTMCSRSLTAWRRVSCSAPLANPQKN